ncbi:hypothetical protein [Actinoplanes regularis]|uniref:hypothetical protein n=1 Tax=Actinoplanes regularis TaxID=52697 RepID=UPI0024A382BA|nr:hypothetical protein [Actinoplanes regularis]GLW30387.1 hypothetical protein Areg01_33270 [Actinoplanes regularis]
MHDHRPARSYSLTVPSEEAARAVADVLAQRGHRLVAVRIVDHYHFDPTSWWYGKPSMRPDFTGWWDVFGALVDTVPQPESRERAAIREIARTYGGVAGGMGGGNAETVLGMFNRDGLVHELTGEQAAARRAALAGSSPVGPRPTGPRPAAPLTGRPPADERVELAAIVEGLGDGRGAEDSDDAGELLGDLFNAAMHQGTCYAHTAGSVPEFIMLACDDRIGDPHHGWLLLDLFMIASVGRRDLAATADTRHALGQALKEAPEAVAARQAVADGFPALAARWERESELGRFLLAALAAACPGSGTGLRPAIGHLRKRYTGTGREVTLRLIEALADADPERTGSVLREMCSWDTKAAECCDSPYATPEQQALDVLENLLIEELDRAETGTPERL